MERSNGNDERGTVHGASLYTGVATADTNSANVGKIEGIVWEVGSGDTGAYPAPIAGCAPLGDWAPLSLNFDAADTLPDGSAPGDLDWSTTL